MQSLSIPLAQHSIDAIHSSMISDKIDNDKDDTDLTSLPSNNTT